jgi:hypothetical protein
VSAAGAQMARTSTLPPSRLWPRAPSKCPRSVGLLLACGVVFLCMCETVRCCVSSVFTCCPRLLSNTEASPQTLVRVACAVLCSAIISHAWQPVNVSTGCSVGACHFCPVLVCFGCCFGAAGECPWVGSGSQVDCLPAF